MGRARPKDQGRESRWEKDAMTVEIAFALVGGGVLALLVFAGTAALTDMNEVGVVLGAVAGVWRVVCVLRRFDRGKGLGR
ncbi:DUF6332 family protein [Streptomyces sp. B-S-A8]|uniref:DUF6332 family protein n=2 Tax=Streptomyces solicavernae TaxID=3043614 RepID=A0ABT6RUY4_9ACTN|nr:DUF6332 family protein [Streptomyces sp. B-S-A8]MDI3388243.1 DUF6332 family protein [Streptomyces sp. B-S-A8]